ncbi:uncharacterized protein LOC143255362 isoform X2 [Tachypleus tridentatus]|uniref:uncharacterized protein LOC143255362 isoform X2 n=1 Tax=Tachypleus tridentatus TaxID=6853 RepID=UPI003FD09C87
MGLEMKQQEKQVNHLFLILFLSPLILPCITSLHPNSAEIEQFAGLKDIGNGTLVAEYDWYIENIFMLLHMSRSPQGHTIIGPQFYTGQPGYNVRLSLTTGRINPADGLPYLGVWFTLVRGKFDDVVEWPFQYKFNLTLVDQSFSHKQDIHLSMNPMTAICRLLKQFLRPKFKKPESDGCGKAFFVPHKDLLDRSRYLKNNSVHLRVTVFLEDRGAIPRRAKAYMRGHQLVSEFLWKIEDIDSKIKLSKKGLLSTITSDLFYVNSESYLMVLQLTLNSDDEHLGLFATLVPGDFDDALEWPFAYNFELSIVDQSPGYLTLDRKGIVDPTSGICSLSAFTKPQYQPNIPCGFRRVITFGMLESRNFKKNGNVLVKFTVILDQMPNFAAVSVKDSHLVAEYVWKIPNIERKFQLGKTGRLTNLLSERFYTTDQGYLMQLQVKFQNDSNGYLGLYLTLLEGNYDSLLEWPFAKKFELVVIDQQPTVIREDIVVPVDPNNPYITNEACTGSFWRPVGRNDACGSSKTVDYDTLYSKKYMRYGALLVKVVVFLEEIYPPKFASLSIKEGSLVAEFDWKIRNIDEHIIKADREQFLDSDKFYLSNNRYRMMLRLYPEKTAGFIGLYAVLTKGIYDEDLEWPFNYKYQLTIVDQSEKCPCVDISRTTYPATSSSGCPSMAFLKPAHELAEWSCGEGRMISHRTLNTRGYKNNGTMKVRISVFLKEITNQIATISFHQNSIVSEYSWLVENIEDKISLQKSKELNKIESPLFYTGNQGYAMRVTLVLNDVITPLQSLANHREEYVLGLYLTLHRGRHDAVLRWPFSKSIVLTVVDQAYLGRDLVKVIDPQNTKCPVHAFMRPQEIHNEHSCGFSALMPLERVVDFIKDEALLIRTSIITGQAIK